MQTTVFRNEEQISTKEVLEKFVETLESSYEIERNEIDELTDIVAKNPTDKFIIAEMPDQPVRQGDILIWSELTDEYKESLRTIKDLKETTRMILQDGDSITGDHELIPISGAHFTMKTGRFTPSVLADSVAEDYDCKLLEIDSPFVLRHREHGNITFLTPGKYMFCSQLDSETLEKMRD